MRPAKILPVLALAMIAVFFLVRPFNGKVVGLPSEGEPYDPYFQAANDWFDAVAHIPDQDMPILEKIESKLHYIGLGLSWEKDGKMVAFDTLERKLDWILGKPGAGLPPEVITDFWNANWNFDSVATVHSWKGDLPTPVKDSFYFANAYFDTVALIHSSKLFADSSELWKIEHKLWKLNQALRHEKHAKRGAFMDVEAKLDTLLGEYGVPEDIYAYFDTSDIYLDSVDIVHAQVGKLSDHVNAAFDSANYHLQVIEALHWEPIPPEVQNIEEKLFHLSLALRWQKEAMFWMAPWFGAFGDLEAKLDTLLGWVPPTMNEAIIDTVLAANEAFIMVDQIHENPSGVIEQDIEWKAYYLGLGLHYEKRAKEFMFTDLENKLDILLKSEPVGLPDSVIAQFDSANGFFLDSIIVVHDWQEDDSIKVEWKLHYIKHGLKNQKKAMWWMFRDLERKIDSLSGANYEGLPEEIDSAFTWADEWLDSVNVIHVEPRYPAWQNIEWKIYFLARALMWEKEAKWEAFKELKRKLYEFDKVELKLYYLSKALKYQKDAKRGIFRELETKLDYLLAAQFSAVPDTVDSLMKKANEFFETADWIHFEPGIPEIEKMMIKLINVGDALENQKEATRIMFDSLSFKIHTLRTLGQIPYQGLDPDIVEDFDSANACYGWIDELAQYPEMPDLEKIELMIFYLSCGLQFEKAAKEKMFTQWKEELFEFDKMEKKLYHLGLAAKFQKEAKKGAFLHIEEKLDTLLERGGWDPLPVPQPVLDHFDSANAYFDQISSTHEDFTLRELTKIEMKVNLLNSGFKHQKEASWIMFLNLEEKLDSLLHRSFLGLPDSVDRSFDSANYYFGLVNDLYNDPAEPGVELDRIESMLEMFTTALKFAKEAKWWMFDELEWKIDSLIETGVREKAEDETVPENFMLLQNYPNPFNPITNIEFTIPQAAHVKLEIFNVLGKRVVALVDEKIGAGYKIVEWDGKDDQGMDVSTGVYFYRLKVGDFTQTRKMVLLK